MNKEGIRKRKNMRRIIREGKAGAKRCSIRKIADRDRAVGTATRYGLDDPGIVSPRGRVFQHASRTAQGQPSLLYNGYGSFSWK
jgi:hypothetical protein